MDIKANQQVVWKQKLQGGLKKIMLGTVVAMSDDGKKATVSFPAERVRRDLPVTELQPAQSIYGRARVDLHPVRRLVSFLR